MTQEVFGSVEGWQRHRDPHQARRVTETEVKLGSYIGPIGARHERTSRAPGTSVRMTASLARGSKSRSRGDS